MMDAISPEALFLLEEKLKDDELNLRTHICPNSNHKCTSCKLKQISSQRIVFHCNSEGDDIIVLKEPFKVQHRYCRKHPYQKLICGYCDHYGDCMISTSMHGGNPFADICEFAEGGYITFRLG